MRCSWRFATRLRHNRPDEMSTIPQCPFCRITASFGREHVSVRPASVRVMLTDTEAISVCEYHAGTIRRESAEEKPKSKTPRTDAELDSSRMPRWEAELDFVDFARQLETELAAKDALLKKLADAAEGTLAAMHDPKLQQLIAEARK